jgi:FtsP/CotA-like multicopper oxidase with cupredoxin domain
MTGGAMGGMAKAIYKGKELPNGDLVDKHNMIWALNGVAGMPEKPLFSAKKGQTIEVRMLNNTAFPHVMHFHGHHVLEVKRIRQTRKGRKTITSRDDWRDSVLMDRSEEVTVTLVADNPGKWMLHCHMLEHQAGGMMTWFEVQA